MKFYPMIILFVLIILFVYVAFLLFHIPTVHMLCSDQYYVTNNEGKTVDVDVYINRKTVNGEDTKELILHFAKATYPKYLTIAVYQELIGVPDNYNKIKIKNRSLSLPRESLIFTPINVGIEQLINTYNISDSVIVFETFGDLKLYGDEIFITKK